MKNRLIILSDLWGKEKSKWISHYLEQLQHDFTIQYYDCCSLGHIDKSDYTQENLHTQFVNGGIERAVQNLIQLETDKTDILAFSIGGAIAWKYGVETGNIKTLYSISATRLRHESRKPYGKIMLFYGDQDYYAPDKNWFYTMNIKPQILKNKKHEVYTEKQFSKLFCKEIITQKPY